MIGRTALWPCISRPFSRILVLVLFHYALLSAVVHVSYSHKLGTHAMLDGSSSAAEFGFLMLQNTSRKSLFSLFPPQIQAEAVVQTLASTASRFRLGAFSSLLDDSRTSGVAARTPDITGTTASPRVSSDLLRRLFADGDDGNNWSGAKTLESDAKVATDEAGLQATLNPSDTYEGQWQFKTGLQQLCGNCTSPELEPDIGFPIQFPHPHDSSASTSDSADTSKRKMFALNARITNLRVDMQDPKNANVSTMIQHSNFPSSLQGFFSRIFAPAAAAGAELMYIVNGVQVLRDGRYSSDNSMYVYWTGVYFNESSVAVMIGAPARAYIDGFKAGIDSLESMVNLWTAYATQLEAEFSRSRTPAAAAAPFEHPHACSFLGAFKFSKTGEWTDKYLPAEFTSQPYATSKNPNSKDGDAEEYVSIFQVEGEFESYRTAACPLIHVVFAGESFVAETFMVRATIYAIILSVSALFQLHAIVRQMKHASSSTAASRLSILTIGTQTMLDAYCCLFHLMTALMIPSLFSVFSALAFLQFLLFSIFEMRTMLSAHRAQQGNGGNEGWGVFRFEAGGLYSRFYMILIFGIVFMYNLGSVFWRVVMVLYCFWIPQIVSSIWSNLRRPLDPQYIVTMSVSRLVLPGYFLLLESNFLEVEPNPYIFLVIVLIVAVQGAILLLQYQKGPRFFVPDRMLPARYSYYRPLPQADVEAADGGDGPDGAGTGAAAAHTCVICMQEIEHAHIGTPRIMVTPCNHLFHSECLQQWMDINLVCPTCRAPLPES
eukprot:ANDGO_01263.mRNA.1 Transmembrane E3 ubiquitin-protein ligase 1